ncbi:hypothetical protein CCB81_03915 [Armatimonadetes bacterium Uphvl-Ar2]|nr:hypothetical protein CCB81_03915 [Armatimonadetes bacterium Uphvl-Ar2]
MDKGGDEHLVALQRLENEFAALDAELSRVDQELSQVQKDIENGFEIWREVHCSQVYVEQIREMKHYWKAADAKLLKELIQTANQTTGLFMNEEYSNSLHGSVAKQAVASKLNDLQRCNRLLLNGRNALSAAVVRFILADTNQTSAPGRFANPYYMEDDQGSESLDSNRGLTLAEVLRLHGEFAIESVKGIWNYIEPNIILPILLILTTVASAINHFAGGKHLEHRFTFYTLYIATIFALLFMIWKSLSDRKGARRRIMSRANFLLTASEFLSEPREQSSTPLAIDLITFAAQHFDDEEIEPEAFEYRTAELKALIAGTPPSGPTATTTQ